MTGPGMGENLLFSSIGESELANFQHHCVQKLMIPGEVLQRTGTPVKNIYFPLSGMVSMLATAGAGDAIDTAVIGREGMIAPADVNGQSQAEAVVRIAGSAWQVPRSQFAVAWEASGVLRTLTAKFHRILLIQVQQSAVCHAFHPMEARLCRWLLQAQDLTGSDTIPLTEGLFAQILGARSASVPLVARILEEAGLIGYSEIEVRIRDRSGLENTACECYEKIHDAFDELLGSTGSNNWKSVG